MGSLECRKRRKEIKVFIISKDIQRVKSRRDRLEKHKDKVDIGVQTDFSPNLYPYPCIVQPVMNYSPSNSTNASAFSYPFSMNQTFDGNSQYYNYIQSCMARDPILYSPRMILSGLTPPCGMMNFSPNQIRGEVCSQKSASPSFSSLLGNYSFK